MFRSASPLGGSRTASPRPGNRTPRSGSLAVVDSRGAQGAGGRSLTPTNFALGPGDIGKYESNYINIESCIHYTNDFYFKHCC